MKNYIYTFGLGAALLLSSCGNEWLNLEPNTSIEMEGSLSAMQDIKASIDGIYSTMQNAYAYTGRLVYYADAAGDDMQAYSATKRVGDIYLMSHTPINVKTSYWLYPYSLISACNIILDQIGTISDEGDAELKSYYKGQVLALRGMFLFDLTRIFGYPYKKDNGASLGVPIVNKVLDKDAKPSRNTVAECYQQIISDLTEGISLMNTKEGKKFHKGQLNLFGAQTLLSRIYLYHGDDELAFNTAVDAIDGAKAAGYKLWTNEEYAGAWSADVDAANPGETLFEIINLTDDSPGKEALGYLYDDYGYYDAILTSSFYSLISEDSKDVRLSVCPISTKRTKRAFCKKFAPQGSEGIQDANIRLLRLSEAYLNAAEAAVKTDKNKEAITYLDEIVNRANPAKHVTGTVTLEQVMTERRKELFGEGHRLFDALRDGGVVERKNVSVKAISSTKHLSMSADAQKFDWNYFHCILPIPISEIDANPNIKQNPGY